MWMSWRHKRTAYCVWLVVLVVLSGAARGEEIPSNMGAITCPDAQILGEKLFTGVCWSCMFPIRIGGVDLITGDNDAPDDAADSALCACSGDLSKGQLPTVGFTLGFWQPTRLIEVTRRAFCYPSLGGITLSEADILHTANSGTTIGTYGHTNTSELGYYNFHYYSFPLLTILELLDVPKCNVGGYSDLDILVMGEYYPNWDDEQLSMVVNPEVTLFAQPEALTALPIDCAAESAGEVLDNLYWVAGCWGSMYPLSGLVASNTSPVESSSLLAARALALLSRIGLIERTVGDDAVCEGKEMPIIKKSQYRLQMMYPVGEAEEGKPDTDTPPSDTTMGGRQVPEVDLTDLMEGCCHNLGKSTYFWGEWRSRPGTGEDFVYLLWQWTDCCLGMIPE